MNCGSRVPCSRTAGVSRRRRPKRGPDLDIADFLLIGRRPGYQDPISQVVRIHTADAERPPNAPRGYLTQLQCCASQRTMSAWIPPKKAARHGSSLCSHGCLTTALTEKKVQGHECCDRKRGNDHEHHLHRISSSQDRPLFVARSPLSDKRGHGCCSPINAGRSPCVLQSIT